MKNFYRLFIIIVIVFVLTILGVNLYLSSSLDNQNEKIYDVEINRLADTIKNYGLESVNLDEWDYVTNVTVFSEFDEADSGNYKVNLINDTLYRFDYERNSRSDKKQLIIAVNVSMALFALVTLIILLFVWRSLVRPFNKIKEVPYELSKGNLSVGLKENKNKFFGEFVWGLDMLREHLERQKEKELELLKENKTLLLSISHDIKTPLSAIKLYSYALIKDLYKDDKKQKEVAKSINLHADEIETYVSQIIKASGQDLLDIEVTNKEYYLDSLLKNIKIYYKEKLSLLNIEFTIKNYENCLLSCDLDRATEVLQNIIENAIKYSDGKYITIDITKQEAYQLITIANSGCSLSPSETPYIFNSFWRGSNVKNFGGSGLGLYICRQLMLKMNGDIYAACSDNEFKVTAVFKMC